MKQRIVGRVTKWVALSIVVVGLGGWAPESIAQESAEGAPERSPEDIYADAVSAADEGDLQRALDLLELAEMKERRPKYAYRKVLVLKAMGEDDRALDILQERRDELAGAPGVGNLDTLEQRLRNDTTEADADGPGRGNAVLSWSLVGGGTVFAAAGTTFLVLAARNSRRLNCSIARIEGRDANCSNVEVDSDLSRSEYRRRRRNVRTFRWTGASLLTVGIGAAGWGTYRLLSHGGQRQAAQWEFFVLPTPTAGLRVRF